MAKIRVGINGFGRIGRVLLRAAYGTENKSEYLEFVGINSLDNLSGLAHLLKYDSTHGVFPGEVYHDESNLIVNGQKIPVTKVKSPAEIPWSSWGADLVLECSGVFKRKEDFMAHIEKGGAKRVLVSAPAEGADGTFVYGVNHAQYDPSKHRVVSNASCTTNCLAPMVKVLHETFGVTAGTMMTIHSYTNDQRVLDTVHTDLRRARAAATNMIPTSTGAAKAVGLVLPDLKGKIDGISIRVPTPNVSLLDFTFNTSKDMTKESINQAFIHASETTLKGVLATEKKELVSSDFNGNSLSSIVDLASTMVVHPRMAKVLSWYDNETGFSHRMIDFAKHMAEKGF